MKYIAFYNDNNITADENRITNLALTNKANYIVSALIRCGHSVEIVSPCWTNNETGFYRGKLHTLSENLQLRNFSTFGSKIGVLKKLNKIFSAQQLLLYLIFRTKKQEQIIVYHSLALKMPIKIAKAIKKLQVILEVEEIYTDVWNHFTEKNELAYIGEAEKYIIVSDILKEKLPKKPSVVLYGSYNLVDAASGKSPSDNKQINLVYAGSIDETKGGALNAVLAVPYLPDNYFLHILGFGSDASVEQLKQAIKDVNSKSENEKCNYHGVLTGDKLKDFLLGCDIGLNPQYEGEYMNTAFPSKVLSYLSHNLKVVSTKIESIMKSKVSSYIIFAQSDKPSDIAQAIISAAESDLKSPANIVKELDENFVSELSHLIEK